MLLNIYQAYTMEVMKQLKYIRCAQLERLMQWRFDSNSAHVERNIRQLRYANYLSLDGKNNEFVRLLGKTRDKAMLAAVDVMLSVCDKALPEFSAGEPPCKLFFSLHDQRGYLDFKVVPVPAGEEALILAKLASQAPGFVCTFLFLIENERQISSLIVKNPAYYVLPNGKGGYNFLKTKVGGSKHNC